MWYSISIIQDLNSCRSVHFLRSWPLHYRHLTCMFVFVCVCPFFFSWFSILFLPLDILIYFAIKKRRKKTGDQQTYMCPFMTPFLAISWLFFQNMRVTQQMAGYVTVRNAMAWKAMVMFKQPTLDIKIIYNQLGNCFVQLKEIQIRISFTTSNNARKTTGFITR